MSEDNEVKKSRFVSSVILLILIIGGAFALPIYVPTVPALAAYGGAMLLIAMVCPWIRRNLGNIVLPIGGLGLLAFALIPNVTNYLPSAEQAKAWIPKVEWPQTADATPEERNSEGASAEVNSGNNTPQQLTATTLGQTSQEEEPQQKTEEETQPQVSEPVVGIITPSAPVVQIREKVDAAVVLDQTALAVIQNSDPWGGWLAYSVWVKESIGLEPDPSEFEGLRDGLAKIERENSVITEKRAEMVKPAGLSFDPGATKVTADNDDAQARLNWIYSQYVEFIKN